MTTTPRFEPFESWAAVLAWVAEHGYVYYHAPMDRRPVRVLASISRRREVKVMPCPTDADPFTAGPRHLDRMRRPGKG